MELEALASVALCNLAARSSRKHLLVRSRRPSPAISVTALAGFGATSNVLAPKKKSRQQHPRTSVDGPDYLAAARMNAAKASHKTARC